MRPESENIPNVSGISPSEGPPGTKITIRGHNLGIDASDVVSVFVCEFDCSKNFQWVSPGKIICVVDSPKMTKSSSGSVIVSTKSGGEGICGVNFYLSFNKLKPLTYSSVWIDEEYEGFLPGQTDVVEVDVKEIIYEPDPLGILHSNVFSSGPPISHESLIQYTSKLVDQSFHPSRFLLDRHSGTKWENLKKGLDELKKQLDVTPGTETAGSSSYLTKNIAMVINVISDMNKLSKLSNVERFYFEDLKSRIEALNNLLTAKFSELAYIYSKTVSLMKFVEIYNNHSTFLSIPRTVHISITTKTNYQETLNLCILFDNRTTETEPNVQSLYAKIDSSIKLFIGHIIGHLHILYPLHFPSINDFMKKIENFKTHTHNSLKILQSHLLWISEKFESYKQFYSSYTKKQLYHKSHIFKNQKNSLTYKLENFLIELTSSFSTEFTVATNIVEIKTPEYKKLLRLNSKKERCISELLHIDEIFKNYFESFFTTLRVILFTPWNVSRTKCSRDICCALTILPEESVVKVYESISNVGFIVKNSSLNQFVQYLQTQKLEKCSLNYNSQFSDRHNLLLYDSFIILKKYYIHKLKKIIKYRHSYVDAPIFYVEMYPKTTAKICSILVDWLKMFREIFKNMKTSKISGEKLSTKFEFIFPRNFLHPIIIDEVDNFLSSNKSLEATISYYDFLFDLNSTIYEKISASTLVIPALEELNVDFNEFLQCLKNETIEIEKTINRTLLIKICEYFLNSTLFIIQKHYFSQNDILPEFYSSLFKCLIDARLKCMPYNNQIFQIVSKEILKLFPLFVLKSFDLQLSDLVKLKLKKNIVIVQSFLEFCKIDFDKTLYLNLLVQLENVNDPKLKNKVQKIIDKYEEIAFILSS